MEFRLDRTELTSCDFHEAEKADRAYWMSKTPQERLAAMEYLRRLAYGESACTARIQRVLEIVENPDATA